MREQRGEAIDGVAVGNAREDVPEPGEGVHAGQATGSDEAHQHGRRPAADVAAHEHPVAAAHGDAAQRPFGRVVVDA